jgi:hypothetical protein
MYPRYAYPKSLLASLAAAVMLSRHRRFAEDARACTARIHPPLQLLGTQHIPDNGSYVITTNHYFRPGYGSQWTALAISTVLADDVHWVMTSELTFPGRWYAALAAPASRLILKRIAAVYGFTAMPPMPPRPYDLQARAGAVRSVLQYAERAERPIIGLAPEGGDQPGGQLYMPPAGVGRLCLRLAAIELRFLPVGVYECDGRLTLNFGEDYELSIGSQDIKDRDRRAAYTVMQHIAPLLPAGLRGEFANGSGNEALKMSR